MPRKLTHSHVRTAGISLLKVSALLARFLLHLDFLIVYNSLDCTFYQMSQKNLTSLQSTLKESFYYLGNQRPLPEGCGWTSLDGVTLADSVPTVIPFTVVGRVATGNSKYGAATARRSAQLGPPLDLGFRRDWAPAMARLKELQLAGANNSREVQYPISPQSIGTMVTTPSPVPGARDSFASGNELQHQYNQCNIGAPRRFRGVSTTVTGEGRIPEAYQKDARIEENFRTFEDGFSFESIFQRDWRETRSTINNVIDVDAIPSISGGSSSRGKRKATVESDDEVVFVEGPSAAPMKGGKKAKPTKTQTKNDDDIISRY
ncbi:hypothetical protein C8J55DRAFT_578357 [Lentinula edodes]|uniref:Uncharacterized protein n=1 Tax=Lentinula lateritia TaxID=40482 RepID=A0A9W9DM13_9AGAR|nr:hypothetical protein C8J55DRAFT_578357 [Lentinula edodes]